MSAVTGAAPPTARALEGLRAGRLDFQRCASCAAAVFPARVVCPGCGTAELAWETSTGLGVVYAATTVHRREGRHGVVLVDVDEGFRLMTSVVGADPDAVTIGARVRLVPAAGDPPRALFSLDEGGHA